jgi:hypothetical protein
MASTLPVDIDSFTPTGDLQRCLARSAALAAPGRASTATVLLAIVESGADSRAGRLLAESGVRSDALAPLEAASRPSPPPRRRGLRRLTGRPPGRHGPDVERALRQAAELASIDDRRTFDADDLFVATLLDDGPAIRALTALGQDAAVLRAEMMRRHEPPGR